MPESNEPVMAHAILASSRPRLPGDPAPEDCGGVMSRPTLPAVGLPAARGGRWSLCRNRPGTIGTSGCALRDLHRPETSLVFPPVFAVQECEKRRTGSMTSQVTP